MKALILSLLFFTLIAEAKVTTKARKPSNKFPQKIATFVCKEEGGEVDLLVGIANITLEVNDSNAGRANSIIYVKKNKDFETINMSAKYSSVPGGFILFGRGKNFEQLKLNIHPNESTLFNGQQLYCSITGQLESI